MNKTLSGRERLIQLIEKKGLTQADIAYSLDIDAGHLSRVLRPVRPSLDLAVRIERLYGIPVASWSDE